MLARIQQHGKRAVITAFIMFHLYLMATWGLPGSSFRFYCTQPIEPYVIYSGLWHSWDMFSPDPLAINFDLRAVITYQDGTTNTWVFPRMERMGYNERFQKERYRKWRERVRLDAYSMVWDDTARFIARLTDTPTNHPAKIALVRYWQPIPAPIVDPKHHKPQQYQPMIQEPKYLFHYQFATYDVQPKDL